MVHTASDSDMATVCAMAAAAEHAGTLMPANTAPGHFDTSPELQGAFDKVSQDVNNLLAASLIAREAGAVATDARGRSWHPRSDTFLAAGPGLHAKLLDILAGVPVLG